MYNNMKKFKNLHKTQIKRVVRDNGESIEEMLRRMTANKEPIPNNVPPIYTPYKDGIIPDYDIRADRFDVAMQARDKQSASEIAKGAEIGDLADFGNNEDSQEQQQTNEN